MPALLGPFAAFGASLAWAYATARYAKASRDVGSVRINLARALVALPVFGAVWLLSGARAGEVSVGRALWLLLSVLSSYALADSVFLTAARRAGVTTALSIASTYPLWAALWGALAAGEALGAARMAGIALAVGGVVWLVQLGAAPAQAAARAEGAASGVLLAGVTSLLWAANSVAVKHGSTGLDLAFVNTLRYGMAVFLLAPQVRFGPSRGLSAAPVGGWLPILPAILADAVIGSSCYVYGLSHTDLAVGATLSSLAPLVAVPVAVLLGEERWSTRRALAVVTTVAGVVVLVGAPGA